MFSYISHIKTTDLIKNSWVEIDPQLIIDSVVECIEKVGEYLAQMGLSHKSIKGTRKNRRLVSNKNWIIYFCILLAVGLTNQRETTILWDKVTGKALYNAIGNSINLINGRFLK